MRYTTVIGCLLTLCSDGFLTSNQEKRRLKYGDVSVPQENHKLRDQNDDLNAQILSLSLYEAKNLLASHTKAQCLAAEIQTATRDEVGGPQIVPGRGGWSTDSPGTR